MMNMGVNQKRVFLKPVQVKAKQIVLTVFTLLILVAAVYVGLGVGHSQDNGFDLDFVKRKTGEPVDIRFTQAEEMIDRDEVERLLKENQIEELNAANNQLRREIDTLKSQISQAQINKQNAISFPGLLRQPSQTTAPRSEEIPIAAKQLAARLPVTQHVPVKLKPVEQPTPPDFDSTVGEVMNSAVDNTRAALVGEEAPSFEPPKRMTIVTIGSKSAAERSASVGRRLQAGLFGEAVLLSGLDAPTGGTAIKNPQPTLLKLVSPGTLPNHYRSRVEDCFVVAAGHGDLASERAYLRLTKLSCVLPGGRVVEAELKGVVVGEDGKTGVRGRLVTKQGALIARAALAGLFSGLGDAVSQSYNSVSTASIGGVGAVSSTINPDRVFEKGLANGFSNAMEKISDWYLQRANETFPVLEVDAGRHVEIFLTEGTTLKEDLLWERH